MSTTRPPRGVARARAIVTLAGLALATGAHAGTPTATRWAAPVSGNFYDLANWDNGVGPAVGANMVIDATGQPYTVDWLAPFGQPRVNSFLLDSDDARVVMRGGSNSANTDFRVSGDTTIRRGVLDLNGQIFGTGALRIDSAGTLDVQEGPSGAGFRGAQLALDVFNSGDIIVRGRATLTQIRATGVLPTGIRIVNEQTGTMRFEGGNIFTAGILDNHGLIVLENDPQFSGAPPLGAQGVSFGPEDIRETSFNNHGTLRVEQGRFGLGGQGLHTGEFHLSQADATIIISGTHGFLPSSRITGPGLTRILHAADVIGVLRVDGSLEYQSSSGEINPALDVAGSLILGVGAPATDFRSTVAAGLITGDLNRAHRFHAAADVAFDGPIGSAEFFAPAAVRGDLFSTAARTIFHENASVQGSVGNAAFMRDAIIGGSASNVEFELGASIGGNLTGGATAIGRVNVGGNLTATTGNWSFQGSGSNNSSLNVAGDIAITRPFEITGEIIAQGDFSAVQGRYSHITADTIAFGGSTLSSFGSVTLFGNARIETGGARAVIERARISSDFGGSPTGSETVTFVNGFEVIYTPVTQFFRSGFSVVVNADQSRATTFAFLADSILAGTLDVAILGDAASLSFGDSFTILEGAVPFGSPDPLPTLTGEFDRLFLPTLSNGLFFDLVYDANTVRLVVVPAPGAASLLVLAALATTRRRTR